VERLNAWLSSSPSPAEVLGVFALLAFLSITMLIGLIHEARILAEWLLILVAHGKREINEARVTGRRLVNALTKWDAE
jgi:hypothetical protein